MTQPYRGPFLGSRIAPPLQVGAVSPSFGQPYTPIAPGSGGGLEGFLSGLSGPLSLALPALSTLGSAAQGGPSNATSLSVVDPDFGDIITPFSAPFATGAFAFGDNPSAGGTSLTSPVEARGSERSGGAEGQLVGGNPNQAGPGVPGFPSFVQPPGGAPAAGSDRTLLYVALGGAALVVLMVAMKGRR